MSLAGTVERSDSERAARLGPRLLRAARIVLVFTAVAVVASLQVHVARLGGVTDGDLLYILRTFLPYWLLVAAFTPVILWLYRVVPLTAGPRAWLVHGGASVVLALLQGMVKLALWLLLEHLFDFFQGADVTQALDRVGEGLLVELVLFPVVYWAIVGVRTAWDWHQRERLHELEKAWLQSELGEARVQALRMQLNPHFLFNALNTVTTLMHRDVARAEVVLERLGVLLRTSLEGLERTEVSLAEELEFVDSYVEIERIRFGDRLRFEMHVAPEVRGALVPGLLLQPLVENAVRHGIAPLARGGLVQVEARAETGCLVVVVSDDGVGLGERTSASGGHRVGLGNTQRRLRLVYGGAGSLTLAAAPEGGTVVTIRLPLRLESAGPCEHRKLAGRSCGMQPLPPADVCAGSSPRAEVDHVHSSAHRG